MRRVSRIAPTTPGHVLDDGFLDPAIRPVYRPIKLMGRAFTVDSPPVTRASSGAPCRKRRAVTSSSSTAAGTTMGS